MCSKNKTPRTIRVKSCHDVWERLGTKRGWCSESVQRNLAITIKKKIQSQYNFLSTFLWPISVNTYCGITQGVNTCHIKCKYLPAKTLKMAENMLSCLCQCKTSSRSEYKMDIVRYCIIALYRQEKDRQPRNEKRLQKIVEVVIASSQASSEVGGSPELRRWQKTIFLIPFFTHFKSDQLKR